MEYQQTREVDKKLCNNLMWRNRHIRTYGPDKKKKQSSWQVLHHLMNCSVLLKETLTQMDHRKNLPES